MTFWIAAGLLTAVCVAAMLAALRARPDAGEASDAAVYRDQLRELERDAARGTLAPEEAQAARAEVARRLLAAADAARPRRPGGATVPAAALVCALVVGASVATYLAIGRPGYPDLPARRAHRRGRGGALVAPRTGAGRGRGARRPSPRRRGRPGGRDGLAAARGAGRAARRPRGLAARGALRGGPERPRGSLARAGPGRRAARRRGDGGGLRRARRADDPRRRRLRLARGRARARRGRAPRPRQRAGAVLRRADVRAGGGAPTSPGPSGAASSPRARRTRRGCPPSTRRSSG